MLSKSPFEWSAALYAAIFIVFLSLGSLIWLAEKRDSIESKNVVLEIEETHTKIDLAKDKTTR